MKTIRTLIPDIYDVIRTKPPELLTGDSATFLSKDIASRLNLQYGHSQRKPTLRLSQMGPRCPKALWYSIHHPECAEPLPPWAEIKYSYGHVLEALAISLAKAAGHDVRGEQDELNLDGIVGHRDAVIDGCVVDVKSSSSFGFRKFSDGTFAQADNFGYLDQLDGYVLASADDPLVQCKDRGYILAIDKQLGKMVLYEHTIRPDSIRRRISDAKKIVDLSQPPPCRCGTELHGKSGNIKLDVRASYSAYKYVCWPGLRTFIYADGPVYLTSVSRKPDVLEVDQHGHPVYVS